MKHLKFAIALCGSILLYVNQTEAKISGCYERVYDKEHLRQHDGQLVRAIQLQIGVQNAGPVDDEEDGDEDSLAIRLADRKGLFYASIFCRVSEDEAECRNEVNRENLNISKTSKGVKIIFGTAVTFQLEAEEKQISIPDNRENQTYALVKVSDATCSYFDK
jgi:hypothetical protein